MQNRKVILLVKTRKMFCSNCKCEKKTFSECHPFVENNGKKTRRLVQNILFTSAQLSSVNAAKILKSNSIEVGKSSICSLLKKMPSIMDKSSVKKVCDDDFALRKRFLYGTVMVDLESQKIIDLIPTRNTNEVKEWLSKYSNIEVISRDSAQLYANVAERSHPGIIQVSDRFHIIKGLTEAITKYMIRTFPARIEIPAVSAEADEILKLHNINNRKERVSFAHQKRSENMTVNEIALLLHSSVKTV